jgi:hypothetical protein
LQGSGEFAQVWRPAPGWVAEAARAHELVERAAVRGKIVLMVGE